MDDDPIDRRRLVGLLLAAAVVPLTAGTGAPFESVSRSVHALAAGYSSTDPRRTGAGLQRAERAATGMFDKRSRMRDAKAVYARLLTLSASVSDDLGDYPEAIRTADMAASLATEVGDAHVAGYAWSIMSGALHHSGRHQTAIDMARRAASAAGASPSGAMAYLEEATAAAAMGRRGVAMDAVVAAEAHHGRLGDHAWGMPGFGLNGTYHPANLKAFAGAALVDAGLYAEAMPRLDEASAILADAPSVSILVFAQIHQARAALGCGDVDAAHAHALAALRTADARRTAYIAGSVVALDIAAGGAFGDLVDVTRRWGFGPTAA